MTLSIIDQPQIFMYWRLTHPNWEPVTVQKELSNGSKYRNWDYVVPYILSGLYIDLCNMNMLGLLKHEKRVPHFAFYIDKSFPHSEY